MCCMKYCIVVTNPTCLFDEEQNYLEKFALDLSWHVQSLSKAENYLLVEL